MRNKNQGIIIFFLFSQGPVQFPANNPSPAKNHPYEKLALKERPLKADRFTGRVSFFLNEKPVVFICRAFAVK